MGMVKRQHNLQILFILILLLRDIEHPNRSILFPIVIAGLPYYLLNYILEKGSWFLSRSALSCLLLVLPRCLLFLLSILVGKHACFYRIYIKHYCNHQ